MPVFDPRLLAEWSGGAWRGNPPGRITGFGIDSRTLQPGQLFVAIETAARDGHAYLSAAARASAPGALVAHFNPDADLAQLVVADPIRALQDIAREHRKTFPGPVIGITGSCGKTSTKDLLTRALGGRSEVGATEGNLNNLLGLPLTLLSCDPQVHRFAVVEAGISEPGEMSRLASILDPDFGIITSIGPAHLEALGSVESVSREKAQLLEHLRPGGRAFFPLECLQWAALRRLSVPVTVIGTASVCRLEVGHGEISTVTYEAAADGVGLRVRVDFSGVKPATFRLASTSHGMVSNAVLAFAAAVELGQDPEVVARRLEGWRPAPLRGEVIEREGRLVYLDCYNANPTSMLDAVRAFVERVGPSIPRLYLIGTMEELGKGARDWHQTVGREWPKGVQDCFVLVGDQGDDLCRGLLESGHDPLAITVNPSPGELASVVGNWTGAVFVKGSRRHRLEERLGSGWRQPVEAEAAC